MAPRVPLEGLFRFRELPATGARGEVVPAEERQLLEQDFFRNSQLAADYENDGALDVGCRSSVPRVTSMKLALTGIVALVTAFRAPTARLAFGCGLAAAVNAVAVFYYRIITNVREQRPLAEYTKLALRWTKRGVAAAEGATVGQRVFAQETIVDGMRGSDWLTTLVGMSIEMFLIAEAVGTNEGFLDIVASSTLIPFMVVLGFVTPSYFNHLRPSTALDGSRVEQPACNWVLSGLSFAAAMAIFGLVNGNLLVMTGWPGDLEAGPARDDATAIWGVVWVQLLYPIVFVVEFLWLRTAGLPEDEAPAGLSTFKDCVYAFSDVSAKGGLALWAAVRAWRA